MVVIDWRESDPTTIAPLFALEASRWQSALGWDYEPTRRVTETARQAGHLPGFLCLDDHAGTVAGWTCFVRHERTLQVGAFVATRVDVVSTLLDAVLASPEASTAERCVVFTYPANDHLRDALDHRRFVSEPYHYLECALPVPTRAAPPVKVAGMTDDDLPGVARLLARAYAGTPSARVFAPTGRLEEWATYLSQLRVTEACGRWNPEASLVCRSEEAGGLAAAIVTTALSESVAHVAQIVVDPRLRGRGVASALVAAAAERSMRSGARRLTLLVADGNVQARRLYAGLGFVERAEFLFAHRMRPARVAARHTETASVP